MFKPAWLSHNPIGDSILVMDPPPQTRLRNLINRAFTARNIAQLEPRVHAIASELADRLATLHEADFIAEFAGPLPARIIGEILGLDPSLHQNFKHWGDDLAAITPAVPNEERAGSIRKTVADMERYMQGVVDARHREPKDDLISALLLAEVDGEKLTDAQVISMMFLILPAGFETTSNLLANSMLLFLNCPDVLAELRSEPALIPRFIDELLRYDPPVHTILRLTTTDVELRGARIPAGSMVVALLGSANRDEAEFADADKFDLHRGVQGGMAFGHGAHFCLGAPLARMEGRIGLEVLLSRFQEFSAVPAQLSWTESLTVRGPVSLPIRFLPS
jgi:hypothetical protein